MNLAELQRKLIAAARRNPPSDRVPYGFEKRITALLQNRSVPDSLALWAGALWRSAAACVAVMLLLGAVSFLTATPPDSSGEMSEDFENIMLVGTLGQDAEFLQ